MTDIQNKNFWIVTLDHYQPVLVTADGDILLEANFSLAEEHVDSGIRLRRLVAFIGECEKCVQTIDPDSRNMHEFGVSPKVVEQLVYLAYWKNYRLELGIDRNQNDVEVRAHFPNRLELSCVLDRYSNRFDIWDGLQSWLNFLCSIIQEHADIWQIHLWLDESLYQQLVIPGCGKVQVEVGGPNTSEELRTLLSPTC
jgi:hypothetical protein